MVDGKKKLTSEDFSALRELVRCELDCNVIIRDRAVMRGQANADAQARVAELARLLEKLSGL
jgi:hypothetical protein